MVGWIFTPIVDEAKTVGTKVTNIWEAVRDNISLSFQTKKGIDLKSDFEYDSSFLDRLKEDESALLNYYLALKSGYKEQDAFRMTMTNASKDAQNYANAVEITADSIAQFTAKQKVLVQVTEQAKSKGLGGLRSILNEYNSALKEGANGLTDCGLKQDEFTEAVGKSNKSLGNWLKGLNGAPATMRGFIGSIVKSIAGTIAFNIAITNLMRLTSDFFDWIENFGDKSETLSEKFDKISSELSDVNSELSSLESELSNVEGQIDELLEKDELSFTDKEELSRLRSVSSELEHQIGLAETLQESLKKNLSVTSIGAYSDYAQNTSFYSKQTKAERKEEAKSMGSSIGNAAGLVIGGILGTIINPGAGTMWGAAIGSSLGSIGGGFIGGAASDSTYESEMTVAEMLDNMRNERIKLEMAQEAAYEVYEATEIDGVKEAWQAATQELNNYNSALSSHISQLSSYYNAVDYASLKTNEEKEQYRDMGDDLDRYNIEMGVSGAKTIALDRIFGKEQITDEAEKLKETVQAALNSGEEIHFYDLDSSQFKETTRRLTEMGISLEDVIGYFSEVKEEAEAASHYETYDMVKNIATLSSGIKELVEAFKEFNAEGVLSAETLVKLNGLFGGLGEEWTNFVDIMTSGDSSMAEAADATQKIAEKYFNSLLKNGGIKFNRKVVDEETGDISWEHDTDQYNSYLTTITQLELLGVENAKEYIDALQQRAMLQEIIAQMRADEVEKETLLAKKFLNKEEKARLAELQKTPDDYIFDVENQYGIKFSNKDLIDKQKEYEQALQLAEDYAEFDSEMSGILSEYNSSNALFEEKYGKLLSSIFGMMPYTSETDEQESPDDGFFESFLRPIDDSDAMAKDLSEAVQNRRELFEKMLDIAERAGIVLGKDIDVTAFNPSDSSDNSIFAQVYNKIISELEKADYEELASEAEEILEQGLTGEGLNVKLNLGIDEIVIDGLESTYGLLKTAEAEMNSGTGLSINTIKSLSAEEKDYLDYLYEENGLIKLNTEAWKERANLKIGENLEILENEILELKRKRVEIEANLNVAKEDGDTSRIKEFTVSLDENTEKLQDNEHQLGIIKAIYDSYADSVDRAAAAQNKATTSLSGIQKLQAGFDQLDKIYADVYDKEDFDWSSVINNQDFANAFGNLGDAYTDFIQIVTNSPDDIAACQSAFDSLATAYLWNSDALTDVSDETRNATVLMLEQMGVANAAAIVDQRLAYNKERLKYTTDEYADAEYDEIYALYQLCEAGTLTQQVLAELAIEKLLINENGIKTSSDIDQLISLANSAKATEATLVRLAKVKELLAKSESLSEEASKSYKDSGDSRSYQRKKAQSEAYSRQAEELLAQDLEYDKIDPSEFKVDYSGGSATDSSKDKIEAFDWIEVAIDRIEQAIDRLKKTAESTYKSLKGKLGASADEISLVNKEIAIQQQAYNRYMQKANSIGLDVGLAEKVRNGSIQISDYDENTRDLISDYQKWFEAATNCEDAIVDLHGSLASLYEDNFNNIQEDFENQLELAEHQINQYQSGIDMLEARGYLESTKYYSDMQKATKGNIAILTSELSSLEQAFSEAMSSGEIEEGSESWYSMKTAINGVKEEIAEANVELAEYAKTIREIKWSYFDYTQERISQITQEADFLIDLLSNSNLHTDKGQLTDDGMATMGLHGQNYNVYMAQADAYAQEILDINKELANDPYNTDLIERREELLGLQQDSILAAEDEKQAIVSLVEEGINLELESLQELIDTYTEALDSAKDLYEYQKTVRDITDEISTLEKQSLAYSGDDSEEARQKLQQISVKLADAREELEETEYDRMVSETKAILDSLYLEYEAILNARLDSVEALIRDMITTVNDNVSLINETLATTANDVGYTMTANMQNIWNGATNALDGTISKYGDDFSTKFTAVQTVLSSIQANTAAMVTASGGEISGGNGDSSSNDTTPVTPPFSSEGNNQPVSNGAKTISIGGKINAGSAMIYDYAGDTSGEYQYYAKDPIYIVLSEENGYLKVRHHTLSSGVSGFFKKSDVKAYKTGGLVDYTGLAQLDGTPRKPELVLNPSDTQNFLELRDALRSMSKEELRIGNGFTAGSLYGVTIPHHLRGLSNISSKISELKGNVVSPNQDITFGDTNINIDHVEDYDDFVTKLQNDKGFENMLLSMTLGRMSGGSSLDKFKYKW